MNNEEKRKAIGIASLGLIPTSIVADKLATNYNANAFNTVNRNTYDPNLIKFTKELDDYAKANGIKVVRDSDLVKGRGSIAMPKSQAAKYASYLKPGLYDGRDIAVLNTKNQIDALTAHEFGHLKDFKRLSKPKLSLYALGLGNTNPISSAKLVGGAIGNYHLGKNLAKKISSGEKLNKNDYAMLGAMGVYNTLPELTVIRNEAVASRNGMKILKDIANKSTMTAAEKSAYLKNSNLALKNALKTYKGVVGKSFAASGMMLGVGGLMGARRPKVDDNIYYIISESHGKPKIVSKFTNKFDAMRYRDEHKGTFINLGTTLKSKGFKYLDQLR